jgi:hypothetical protein
VSEFDATEPGRDHPGEAEEGPAPPHLVLIVRHKVPGGGEGKGVIQTRRPEESLVNPQIFLSTRIRNEPLRYHQL